MILEPRFACDQAVRVIRNLRNDGTYPGQPTGALLVQSVTSGVTQLGWKSQLSDLFVGIFIIIAVGTMMWAAEGISAFVEEHPSVKMLALSFLLLIGLSLVGEGLGHHIPKPYIYFSMAFSSLVEALNIRSSKKKKNRFTNSKEF